MLLGLAALCLPSAEASAQTLESPAFREVAAASGLDFVHWNGMFGRFYFPEVVGSGGALFDFDNDGDEDLYLVQGEFLGRPEDRPLAQPPPPAGPVRGQLYRNDTEIHAEGRRTVRFTNVTAESGIDARAYGMGAAVGDYDNDGWLDLYLTHHGVNQLWRNRGDGTFEDRTAEAGVGDRRWSVPASFFDFDGDGWLDLYVGNYMDWQVARSKACLSESGQRDYCGPQNFTSEPDRLYRNLGPDASGRVRFADVSRAAGIDSEFGAALGVITADFDGDGRTDVYVANDQTGNQLWHNNGEGSFTNDALLMGCALNQEGQAEASMGVDAADFDGDGDEDLFMTHLTRESNTLYVNDGSGLFHDRSLPSGLANASWQATGFGTGFFDFDNDGWLDLFAANGAVHILPQLARKGDPYPLHQPNQLFRNRGDGTFEEVSALLGPPLSEVSRGALFGDIDRDGDTDLVVTNNSGPVRLLLNELGNRQPWIGFHLRAGDPPRDVPGARVALLRPGRPPLWRRVRMDGSYASAVSPRLLFGLGDQAEIERIEVHWLGGTVETWQGLEPGEYHTLRQGEGQKRGTDP